MSRYFTKQAVVVTPSQWGSDDPLDDFGGPTAMTVHEDELETFTGLLDARGAEIHRSERIPLGFRLDK